MDCADFESVLKHGLTDSVAATYTALNNGIIVTADDVTFGVQSLSLTGGISGTTASFTDTFLYGVSGSAGTFVGQATATILANASSAEHGTLDVALDLTTTPAALNTIATMIFGAMTHEGMGAMIAGDPTVSGNSVTYTAGVQDAGHTHADLIVTQLAANSVGVHADYHLVV